MIGLKGISRADGSARADRVHGRLRRGNATNIFVTGDLTHVAGDRYIVIERDDFQGPPTGANPPR